MGAALEWLKEKLADDIKLLSSWDKYKKEVLSGSLEWSPMHTAEQFWLENSPKFEERDCQVEFLPSPMLVGNVFLPLMTAGEACFKHFGHANAVQRCVLPSYLRRNTEFT